MVAHRHRREQIGALQYRRSTEQGANIFLPRLGVFCIQPNEYRILRRSSGMALFFYKMRTIMRRNVSVVGEAPQ
jgi:hypothetical protein